MGVGPSNVAVAPDLHLVEDFEGSKTKMSRVKEMNKFKQTAETLYPFISARANLKCPRCNMLFEGYTGCNALKCTTLKCGADFCAICLEDCNTDAHTHVLSRHGSLDDREAFHRGKQAREKAFIEDMKHEPFEVQELLRIKSEKALPNFSRAEEGLAIDAAFVESGRQSVGKALRHGRTSLLKGIAGPQGLIINDVSPRNAIPKEYRLRLRSSPNCASVCRITLQKLTDGEWKEIPLPGGKDDEVKDSDQPKLDALINIRGSLQCGIVAFCGEKQLYQTRTVSSKGILTGNEVSVVFHAITDKGSLVGKERSLPVIGCNQRLILGLSQNRRTMMLDRHIQESDPSDLLFDALRHYIGSDTPQRVFPTIPVPAPETFKELNREQQQAAHPLALATAVEVAGPPGTGKTRTITELVRSILECTEYHVIVLSERNGAVDAIAEKFADDCVVRDAQNEPMSVENVSLWKCLMAFGSAEGMGSSSKLFTLEAKLSYHPDLVEPRQIVAEKQQDCRRLKTTMLTELAEMIDCIQSVLPREAEPLNRMLTELVEMTGGSQIALSQVAEPLNISRVILSGIEAGLTNGPEIVGTVIDTHIAIQGVLADSALREEKIDDVVNTHLSILGQLLPIRPEKARRMRAWHMYEKEVRLALFQIDNGLFSLIQRNTFSLKNAKTAELAVRKATQSLEAAIGRAKKELMEDARVLLSTIGSSTRLPAGRAKIADTTNSISDAFGRMSVSGTQKKTKTIVVFDEAGCIPSYELLGLSMLGHSIDSLVCVGDKNQLPPYDPSSSSKHIPPSHEAEQSGGGVQSLLDVSQLTSDKGKIKLTKQYRVPHDIANLLNNRIYEGDYQTALESRAPLRGFHFVHIPGPVVEQNSRKKGRKRYDRKSEINKDEIQRCLEIVLQSKKDGIESIMVLTPYKKQQRELQFQFRKNNCEDVAVLTIDQCQGKEADIVVISMVKKPTRFLNKNRLNVALSRVRRKLYFVADKNKFEKASRNSNWECFELAKDLLKLADSDDSVVSVEDETETRLAAIESNMQSFAASHESNMQSLAASQESNMQSLAASQLVLLETIEQIMAQLPQVMARLPQTSSPPAALHPGHPG